ncbi:hypothetical protein [Roseovarius sp. MMSF_3359]|uniref:hypothetical protein n=1 Tax=Roseovarius sp. MMSF_3359 TaxID=3046707 RepID=UPI00273EA1EF|nr:hypothetical protein [Roseovarius sp. MMSF_3359]
MTTIARTFRQIDAALTIAALDGAGFRVFAPHFHIHGTTPHFAIAYGGIAIQVPDSEAPEAVAFLHALNTPVPDNEAPLPAPPAGYRRGWSYSLRQILFFLMGGSSPPAGLFLRALLRTGDYAHNEL